MRRKKFALGYRRTVVAGATTAAVVLIAAFVPNAPGRAAEEPFSNGSAFASGVVAKIAPGVGSLELAMKSGVAVSQVTNTLAQAQAQSLDLGLIGTALTGEGCTGSDPTVSPDELPQPTTVDNRKGDAEATSDEMPLGGSALGGGREYARATKQPLAQAIATTGAINIDPVLRINGGQANAESRVIPGQAREAISTVDANLDLGGLVQLRGLRWEAFHRTGAGPEVRGRFTIEGATAGGIPIPVSQEQLTAVESAVNTALAQTGISVSFPKVERFTEPNDVVRVTPMRVLLKDSPAGAAVLGPVLNLTREQREQLFIEITEQICQTAGLLLVGDIAVSTVAGTGFLAVDVGGVQATTAEIDFVNPFGTDAGLVLPSLPALPGVPALPGSPDLILPPEAGSSSQVRGSRPAAVTGPVERVCESTHPFKWPPCSRGAAVTLGLIGLLVTAGVGVLDWLYQRRKLAAAAAAGGTAS